MSVQDSEYYELYDILSAAASTPPAAVAKATPVAAALTLPATPSPLPSKTPPTAQPSAAKSPPACLRRIHQEHFRDLSEGMDHSPALQGATYAQAPPNTDNNTAPGRETHTSHPLETQSVTSSHSHNQSEPPTTASQGTAGEASSSHPATNQQADPGPWADIIDTPAWHSNAPRTRRHTMDIRIRNEVTLHWRTAPLPRQQLWASHRFEQPINNELKFLKTWFMALKDHDYGIMHIWT